MNMATTLGGTTPFQLMERSAPGTSSALLSSSSSWTGLANGAVNGHIGYASGTQYTFVMTLTRNASSGLDITVTVTGGSLNNTGSASVSFTDNTPNSFSFDTFALRPSSANDSAAQFDTRSSKWRPSRPIHRRPSAPTRRTKRFLWDKTPRFNVLAAGTAPLSYQWYYNTNTPTLLVDATNSIVTLADVQVANSDDYFVVVTNSFGSVTSSVARLTVNIPNPPSILAQPQDQYVSPGGSATFSVVAGGSEPLSYQWYYNTNTMLPNATDNTLTITNVQAAVAGSYSVVVSNLAGGIASDNAFLTINTNPVAPVFISQPASQVLLVGGTASFTASATGTTPISYQWSKNGIPFRAQLRPH